MTARRESFRIWRLFSARRRSAWKIAGEAFTATRPCVRASGSRFAQAGILDMSEPVIKLQPLTPEEILALLKRILYIHAKHYEWDPGVTDEQIAALVQNLAGRMGADVLLTPREVVRDFTGLLNILRQNPAESFDSLTAKLDIKPAGQEGPVQDGGEPFAEFEL